MSQPYSRFIEQQLRSSEALEREIDALTGTSREQRMEAIGRKIDQQAKRWFCEQRRPRQTETAA